MECVDILAIAIGRGTQSDRNQLHILNISGINVTIEDEDAEFEKLKIDNILL